MGHSSRCDGFGTRSPATAAWLKDEPGPYKERRVAICHLQLSAVPAKLVSAVKEWHSAGNKYNAHTLPFRPALSDPISQPHRCKNNKATNKHTSAFWSFFFPTHKLIALRQLLSSRFTLIWRFSGRSECLSLGRRSWRKGRWVHMQPDTLNIWHSWPPLNPNGSQRIGTSTQPSQTHRQHT